MAATSIKDALDEWEKNNKIKLSEAKQVELQFRWPPIAKMDNNLSVLIKCEKLSLSTNRIDKITGLAGLNNLKILALGRNNIKNLKGLDVLADTLEELWISYNAIEKVTNDLLDMRKLKVLYMAHNNIDSWNQVQKLIQMESLQDLILIGNPLYESMEESVWRSQCIKKLPKLTILDGIPVIREPDA